MTPFATSQPAVLAACAMLLAACGGKSQAPDSSKKAQTALERPFDVARVAAGERCPVSPYHRRLARFPNVLGTGPLYAGGLPHHGTMRVVPAFRGPYARVAPKGALVQKTLWIAPPSFRGEALVRLRRLDGPNEAVGFYGPPGRFTRDLHLDSDNGGSSPLGWRNWPTATFVSAAGCFAFRVDTAAGGQTIVFRVVRAATSTTNEH